MLGQQREHSREMGFAPESRGSSAYVWHLDYEIETVRRSFTPSCSTYSTLALVATSRCCACAGFKNNTNAQTTSQGVIDASPFRCLSCRILARPLPSHADVPKI